MKINNYAKDTNVTATDKWIGTDSNNFNQTKNFTPTSLADYYNHNQVIDSPYLKFTYQTLNPGEVRGDGTISFVTEIGPSIPFSSISTFLISYKSLKGSNVSQYLNFLNGGKIVLSRAEDINSFGFYEITALTPYVPNTNFFVATLDYIDGNGSMLEDKDYIMSLLIDKYTQSSPGSSQTLNQTLVLGNETLGRNIKINNGDAIELENGSLLKKGSYSFDNSIEVVISNILNSGDGYINGVMGWGNPSGTQWSDLNGTYVKTSTAIRPSAFGAGDIGMHTPIAGTYNYYLKNPISLGNPDPTWDGIAYFLAPGNRCGWGDPNNDSQTDIPVNYWRLCVLSDYPYVYFTNPSSDPYNFPSTNWTAVSAELPINEGGNGATYLSNWGGGFSVSNINTGNGNGGISRICSVGYEDMWQSGIRYTFDLGGNIREATNCFNYIPNNSFDYTKKFKVGSIWTLDDGSSYECTDVSENNAVWVLRTGFIPTLEQVVASGNTTEGDIYLNSIFLKGSTYHGNLSFNNNSLTFENIFLIDPQNLINGLGAEAGNIDSGTDINAFGNLSCYQSGGTDVNGLGNQSAFSNTGSGVNAFGRNSAINNYGNDVNALGASAASENTGDNVNAFGVNACLQNTGDNVNAFGRNAGKQNGINGVTIFSNDTMPSYSNYGDAVLYINVINGASPDCTYLYHNSSTNTIGAVRT